MSYQSLRNLKDLDAVIGASPDEPQLETANQNNRKFFKNPIRRAPGCETSLKGGVFAGPVRTT